MTTRVELAKRAFDSLDALSVLVLLPCLISKIDTLGHLLEARLQNLSEVAAHLVDALAQLPNVRILLLNHAFALPLQVIDLLLESFLLVFLDCVLVLLLHDRLLEIFLHLTIHRCHSLYQLLRFGSLFLSLGINLSLGLANALFFTL